MTKLFKDIPKHLSLREKVDILTQRHENNYFIDIEPDEISQHLSEFVRPVCKVSKKVLDSCVTRDIRAKIKKIHWVVNRDDEFTHDFKEKLNTNFFSSMNEVFRESSKIYSKYCDQYMSSKATVSSVDGRKVYKRKAAQSFDQMSEHDNIELDCKERIIDAVIKNYDKLKRLFQLSSDQLESKISQNPESSSAITYILGIDQPVEEKDRLLFLTISTFFDLINDA
ncbi:hypothetical protein BpHYR1_034945 [Brachionus plicatilis]|uniref:Uncharacterized protein n=1 Tax=Brachionus plicatilis TaxID=10195 RepID=A0A3M7QYT3_BRAPC|nr:hypothetical protein BpHYR1_034945 [Brachionus plicatilis]